MGHAVFESDGSLVQAVDFDYDAVDRNLATHPLITTPREGTALVRVARWIHQDGMNDDNGVMIRAVVFCHNVIPEVREYSMSELSLTYGKKKQSFGRWVDQWKRDFPLARTPHMK